jgi:hypothetical protein
LLSLRILVARNTLFLKKVLAPRDLAQQIVGGMRVLYFRSDCREQAFYQQWMSPSAGL